MATRAECLGSLVFEIHAKAADLFYLTSRIGEAGYEPAIPHIVLECDRLDSFIDVATEKLHSTIEFPSTFMLLSYVATNIERWRTFAGALCGGDMATYFREHHIPAESKALEAAMDKWDIHRTLCELRDAKPDDDRVLSPADTQAVKRAVRPRLSQKEQRAKYQAMKEFYHEHNQNLELTASTFKYTKGHVSRVVNNPVVRNVAQRKRNDLN